MAAIFCFFLLNAFIFLSSNHILGASPHRKNSEDVALLPAREASARYPQMVIEFYERKLTWHCGDEEQWQRGELAALLSPEASFNLHQTPPPSPIHPLQLTFETSGVRRPQRGWCRSPAVLCLAAKTSSNLVATRSSIRSPASRNDHCGNVVFAQHLAPFFLSSLAAEILVV